METENTRLKNFRTHLNMQQGEFCQHLGIKQGSYSDIERGRNSISYQVLKKCMEKFDLNPNWLLTGMGEMFLSEENKDSFEPTVKKNNYEVKDNIVLVEAKAAAGYLQGVRQSSDFLETMPTFRLPGYYGNSFRAFEVKGNSMIPTLFGKDIVVCSKKESLSNIKSGRVYVVVLNDGSIVVKRLSKLGLHYTAISDNDEEYPSYTIDVQEIFEVWEVEARITGNLEEKSKNENNAFKELEKRLQKLELIIGK